MKKIRIGNDIRIKFSLSTIDYNLNDIDELNLSVWVKPSEKIVDYENYDEPRYEREERVVVSNRPLHSVHIEPSHRMHHHDRQSQHAVQPIQLDYEIIGENLHAYWKADDQHALGEYDVILYAKKNEEGQQVADQCRAIRLVAHTAQADAAYQDESVEKLVELGNITIEAEGQIGYDLERINETIKKLGDIVITYTDEEITEVPDDSNKVVKYVPQTLDTAEKTQARQNIGAFEEELAIYAEPEDWDVEALEPELMAAAVRYTEQLKSAAEQLQARTNIGAASDEDFEDFKNDLASFYETLQNMVNSDSIKVGDYTELHQIYKNAAPVPLGTQDYNFPFVVKGLNAIDDKAGELTDLTTDDQDSLVDAINEVNDKVKEMVLETTDIDMEDVFS